MIGHETGAANVTDPLGGSHLVEALTHDAHRRIASADEPRRGPGWCSRGDRSRASTSSRSRSRPTGISVSSNPESGSSSASTGSPRHRSPTVADPARRAELEAAQIERLAKMRADRSAAAVTRATRRRPRRCRGHRQPAAADARALEAMRPSARCAARCARSSASTAPRSRCEPQPTWSPGSLTGDQTGAQGRAPIGASDAVPRHSPRSGRRRRRRRADPVAAPARRSTCCANAGMTPSTVAARPSVRSTPRASSPPASASTGCSIAGSFTELDMFALHRTTNFGMDERRIRGDGVVTGWGTIDGRQVFVFSHDAVGLRRLARRGVRREGHQDHGSRAANGMSVHRHQRLGRCAHPGGRRLARGIRGDLLSQRRGERCDPAALADRRARAPAGRCTRRR